MNLVTVRTWGGSWFGGLIVVWRVVLGFCLFFEKEFKVGWGRGEDLEGL